MFYSVLLTIKIREVADKKTMVFLDIRLRVKHYRVFYKDHP